MSGSNNNYGHKHNSRWEYTTGRGRTSSQHPNHYGRGSECNHAADRSNSYGSYHQKKGSNTSSRRGYHADSSPRKKRNEKQCSFDQRNFSSFQQPMNQPPPVQMPAAAEQAIPMEISRQKKFSDMTWKEKIEYQFLQYEQNISHHSRRWDDIPQEYQKEDTSYWVAKKKRASEIAYRKAIKKMKQMKQTLFSDENSDSMPDSLDSDDGAPYGKRRKKESDFGFSQKDLKDFLEALQYNVIFDMGFRVTGLITRDEENCWCPCGPRMEPWRQQFNIETIAGKGTAAFCSTVKSGKKMTPQGLMDHIGSKIKTGCLLHIGINEYLHVVYGDIYGKIGHKGLYQIGDENYKAAEAAEKKSKHRMMLQITREKDEALNEAEKLKQEREKHKKALEDLGKVNEDLRKKVEQLEKDKELLEVKGQKESTEISEKEIKNFRRSYNGFFEGLKNVVPKKDQPIKIEVKQDFDLSELFKKLNVKNKSTETSFLFRDLDKSGKNNETFAWKLVNDWVINYDNNAEKKGGKDKTIDEGGPTREFFSQTWKQMDCLGVSHQSGKEKIKVSLFERTPTGVIPRTNDELRRKVPKEWIHTIIEKAKKYYRAIGRIMFHSLVTKHPISSEAMPSFFRNIIFRDCQPQDYKYREDIIDHLSEIELNVNLENTIGCKFEDILDYGGDEIITKESIFSDVIPQFFVRSRSIALESIMEGLTLNGAVDLPGIFSIMPLHVVSMMAFTKPYVLAEDVINILIPEYSEDKDLKRDQVEFFNKILPNVLRSRERTMTDEDKTKTYQNSQEDFLSLFVHYITGLFFIPHPKAQPDFKIIIEFSSTEMQPESLPQAHTCVHTYKIPAWVYDLNREKFERKLDQSITLAKNSFGMR